MFPLYSSIKDEQPSYYEIKIESPNNKHQGLIIISATNRDDPIPAFKPFGRSVTEKLKAKGGVKTAKIIWHSPFYAVAVDEKGKEVATYVSKLISEVKKLNEKDRKRYKKGIDEKQYLEQTKNFLQQEFSAGVTIFNADENNVFDPANRARFAAPLKPAIYIE